jgi:hypothetical protein
LVVDVTRDDGPSVREVALAIGIRRYRNVAWRDSTREPLCAWFANLIS